MADSLTFTLDTTPRGVCDICGKPAYAPQAKKCDEHRKYRGRRGTLPPPDTRADNEADDDAEIRIGRPDGDKSGDRPSPTVPDAKDKRQQEIRRMFKEVINPNLAQGVAFACQPIPAVNFYREVDGKIVPDHHGKAVAFEDWEITVLSYVAAEIEKAPVLQTAKQVASPVLPIIGAVGAGLIILMHGARIVQMREQLLTAWREQEGNSAAAQEAARHATSGAAQSAAQQRPPAPDSSASSPPGRPAPETSYNPLRDPLRPTVGDVGAEEARAQEDVTTLPDLGAIFEEEIAEMAGG